jgi:hypothetical protein
VPTASDALEAEQSNVEGTHRVDAVSWEAARLGRAAAPGGEGNRGVKRSISRLPGSVVDPESYAEGDRGNVQGLDSPDYLLPHWERALDLAPSPTDVPTSPPTLKPTLKPTKDPTKAPTSVPTRFPTKSPRKAPTCKGMKGKGCMMM